MLGGALYLRTVLEEPVATTTLYSFDTQPMSLATTADRVDWAQMEATESSQEGRVSSVSREGEDPVVHFSSGGYVDGVVATAGLQFH